ncbi:tyrosine-type recombinase/integrase [Nocardioides ochotonae]|uniref:tyrosine-type recombinase/integrase n=1 Tax=Nocardioides ochotonae TaxID=2685869 RepID=UPI00140AB14E|nr:site-specific integrase [Nocardioides ochotonae]
MTLSAELILIQGDDGNTDEALSEWLAELGWDATSRELRPSPDHPLLGWKACTVEACRRPAWGSAQATETLCDGCRGQWRRAGKPDLDVFRAAPVARDRSTDADRLCRVGEDSARCQRPARSHDLCSTHATAFSAGSMDLITLIATAEPLTRLGECRVAACVRAAADPTSLLCRAHMAAWRRARRAQSDHDAWLKQAPSAPSDARICVLRGLSDLVVEQVLYGVLIRSRRGVQTRLDVLQPVVNWLREVQVPDLRDVEESDLPTAWRANKRNIAEQLVRTAKVTSCSPDEFKTADLWPGSVFGKRGEVDWTEVRLPWLRTAVQEWGWGTVNSYRDFEAIRRTVRAVAVLSNYLEAHAPDGGRSPQLLGRDHALAFGTYLLTLVSQGVLTGDGPANKPWTEKRRHFVLARNRLVIRWARDAGLLPRLAPSFNITNDMVPARPKASRGDDEIGKSLPAAVVQQLLSQESRDLLASVWREDAPRFVLLLAETGRRPTEICELRPGCVDEGAAGGPVLTYTEFKTSGGIDERRLPVTALVARLVREQETFARGLYPHADPSRLALFPRETMNPHGYTPIASDTVKTYVRRWVDALPSLTTGGLGLDGQPIDFDRSLVFPYAFRHTYAQRRADAGVHPDVLKELMGHEQIQTTMSYFKVSRARQREATDMMGSLVLDERGTLRWGGLDLAESLRRNVGVVAVPFGGCSEPSNVAAEGHACPMRWQCAGCDHFSTDPSYLPDLRRHLTDLLAQQARIDAFSGGTDWARERARPSDNEVAEVRRLIEEQETMLEAASPELRTAIDAASTELVKARAAQRQTVAVTLRSHTTGQDALLGPDALLREAMDIVGSVVTEENE